MELVSVNYVAVLVAAVAAMAVGFVWYGPLFGKQWMKLVDMKMSEAKKEAMMKTYAITFVLTLITAYVLAHILSLANATTPLMGLQGAFWMWLGFMMPPVVAGGLFLGKKPELIAIDAGHFLFALLAQGLVLTLIK